MGGGEVRPVGRVVVIVFLEVVQRRTGLYFVIGVMGLLSLHSMLRVTKGVDLGDENPYYVPSLVLNLMVVAVTLELSELQVIVRSLPFYGILDAYALELEPTRM